MAIKTVKFILLFAITASNINMNVWAERPPKDFLASSQCTAKCLLNSFDVEGCRESCVNSTSTMKIGSCPDEDDNGFDFMMSLRNCSDICHRNDYECPDDFKCCKVSACSYDCRKAEFGDFTKDFQELPCMAENVVLKNEPQFSTVSFNWDMCDEGNAFPYVFSVESRNHLGPTLNISQFGEFRLQKYYVWKKARSPYTTHYHSTVRFKAGRFYQMRIASVNFKGTRGYAYSNPFKLDRGK